MMLPTIRCNCGQPMDVTSFSGGDVMLYMIASCNCGVVIDIDYYSFYEDDLPDRLESSE